MLLDYDFTANHKFKLNLLFTAPRISSNKKFCTIQPLTTLKYNISGICFTGLMSWDDVMLVRCSKTHYFIKPATPRKCYWEEDIILCLKSCFVVTVTSWQNNHSPPLSYPLSEATNKVLPSHQTLLTLLLCSTLQCFFWTFCFLHFLN